MWYLAIQPGRIPTLFRWVDSRGWFDSNDDRIMCDPRSIGYVLYPVVLTKTGAALGEALQ